MATFLTASTDLTIDLLPTIGVTYGGAAPMNEQVRYMGRHKESRIRITFGTNGNVYPGATDGAEIALPTTPGTYGFVRNVETLVLEGYNDDGVLWKFVPSGWALRGYQSQTATALQGATQMTVLPTTWAPSLMTEIPVIYLTARGW